MGGIATFLQCILNRFGGWGTDLVVFTMLNLSLVRYSLILNPIPAGVGQFDPPPCSFLYITQKVLVCGC